MCVSSTLWNGGKRSGRAGGSNATPKPAWSNLPFFSPNPKSGGGCDASIEIGLPGSVTFAPPFHRFSLLMYLNERSLT